MSNLEVIDIFTKIFAIYNLVLVVATFILNPLVLFICVRSKKLRSTSTFKLLAFSSINDILVCLAWNQECFTNTFFNLYYYFRSLFYCRWISVFLQFTTLEIESWMLVSISLDRFLSLAVKKWSKHYFNGARPFIYSALLTFVIVAINFNEVFLSGFSYEVNGTEVVVCYQTPPGQSIDWYHIMSQVQIYVSIYKSLIVEIFIEILLKYN